MRYFPLFLDLTGKPVLLVGGGSVAARKFALLGEAGAVVTVVAPLLGDEIAAAVAAGRSHRPPPGGGRLAARKFALLGEAGAVVTVVAPLLGDEIAAAVAAGKITHLAREMRDLA